MANSKINIKKSLILTEANTSDNTKIVEQEKESIHLLIKIATWAHGSKINFQEMASMSTKKDKNTKENFLTAKSTAKAYTFTIVEPSSKANGIKIENTDSVFSLTPTPKNMKETGSMDRNMAKEPTTTKTEINTSETGSKTKRTAMEFLNT